MRPNASASEQLAHNNVRQRADARGHSQDAFFAQIYRCQGHRSLAPNVTLLLFDLLSIPQIHGTSLNTVPESRVPARKVTP
jgi:hypothetical protein